MSWKNKLGRLAISACLILGAGWAAGDPAAAVAKDSANTKAPVKLLFVISLKNARLMYVRERKYQLKFLTTDNKEPILAFSDRPQRVAFRLNRKEFNRLVQRGKDSFKKVPPNAAVVFSSGNPRAKAYEINKYEIDGTAVTLSLTALIERKKGQAMRKPCGKECEGSGDVSLFIDCAPGASWSSSGGCDNPEPDVSEVVGGVIEALCHVAGAAV
jgi:hypothetical protein